MITFENEDDVFVDKNKKRKFKKKIIKAWKSKKVIDKINFRHLYKCVIRDFTITESYDNNLHIKFDKVKIIIEKINDVLKNEDDFINFIEKKYYKHIDDNIVDKFIDEINKIKNDIINNFFINDKLVVNDFKIELTPESIIITLLQADNETEVSKMKFNEVKNNKKIIKEIIRIENIFKKLLKKNKRNKKITKKMIKLYSSAHYSLPEFIIDDPLTILSNKKQSMIDFYKYIIDVHKNYSDDEEKIKRLTHNDYTKYISHLLHIN